MDNLPNLINVLRGDLSVIRPRPTEPTYVDLNDLRFMALIRSPSILGGIFGQQLNRDKV